MGIAFVLYTFVSGGVSMWSTGERRQDLYERAQAAFHVMAADLWCTFRPQVFEEAEPVAAFLADRPGMPTPDQEIDPNANQARPPILGSRLRFVRTVQGEFENPITRYSGVVAGASEHYQTSVPTVDSADGPAPGQSSGAEAKPEKGYKASGGIKEVIYQTVVLPGTPDESRGLGVLVRGERMPVGGVGSFFSDDVVNDPASWTKLMRPVTRGVLYMGLEFWDQNTEAWETEADDVQGRSSDVQQLWDSTRGLLKDFRYYRNGSEKSDIDDIYPQRVRITLILARPGDPSMNAKLRFAIGKYEKEIRVDRPGGLRLSQEAVVLVGGKELMEITRTGSTRAKIISRGALGTAIANHERGAPVVWGELFTRVVNIPCYREYHNP